jgi:peptidoglycan/LPS O-acetylase OafA/YrhL
MLGIIRYRLPGVFLDNPLSGIVNGQLWTVPSELHCYVALAALMITGMATKRWLMAGAFLVFAAGECIIGLLPGHHYTSALLQSAESLVICFLCGNVFYLFRENVPVRGDLFAFAVVGCIFAYYAPILALLIGPVSVTYCVVFIGLHRIPRVPILQRGDYSYGIYLYSFPLQQAAVWALPGLREWYWNLLLGGIPAICFAMMSWHWLEKPALALRRYLAPRRNASGTQTPSATSPTVSTTGNATPGK